MFKGLVQLLKFLELYISTELEYLRYSNERVYIIYLNIWDEEFPLVIKWFSLKLLADSIKYFIEQKKMDAEYLDKDAEAYTLIFASTIL